MKYLTNSGLSYFLNKIKAYIASQLNSKASAIHTHTSSDITDLPSGLVVDSTLDGTSSNAISNSAVSNALDGKISSEIDSMGEGWVRFKSGLQICWGSVPVAIGTLLAYDPPSTMYYKRTGWFNYAKGFSSIPVVSACVFTSNAHPFLQVCVESSADNNDKKLTTGSIMLSCKCAATIQHETSIHIQAIGRWK